jgi:ferric-dicitrate binding protein FerR (iron transport regulator)
VAPALRAQAVTGTFERTRSLDEIVRTIAATLGAQVERTDAGYRIAPRDAS